VATAASETRRCDRCGEAYPGDALFCPGCGRRRARTSGLDPLLGQTVGERFLLHRRLGQGTSGTIYLGEHVTLGRAVAVKVLHPELSRDELAIERFRREATSVSGIDNEHIVEIFDFGRAPDGRLYLAMEHLEGETLADLIARERRLPVARAVDILTQLGEAMMEAHATGYVHRDLRPRNVFLTRRRGRADYVKLLDFGLAKLVESGAATAAATSLGMTFGDPHYMAPEQARGESVDRRADIYSMGCIAYEMLIGTPPFAGGRVFEVLSRHLDERPAAPRGARPDLPAWLDEAIRRMLAKRADDRFVTVFRMIEALRQGLASGEAMGDDDARRAETAPPPAVARRLPKPTHDAVPVTLGAPLAPPSPARSTPAAAATPPTPARLTPAAAATPTPAAVEPAESQEKTEKAWFATPAIEREDAYADEAPAPGRATVRLALIAVGVLIAAVVALAVLRPRAPATAAAPAGAARVVPPTGAPSRDAKAEAARASALGDQAMAAGDRRGAGGHYGRARALDPDQADALIGLGELALGEPDWAAAIDAFERAAALRSDSARILRGLGEAYRGAGRAADAARSFGRALAVDPADARARAGLEATR
jgi:tRNA A-37 threonylcarbamoyl transferase component Bud32/tetratricopeptide (TPR) repeat protein